MKENKQTGRRTRIDGTKSPPGIAVPAATDISST